MGGKIKRAASAIDPTPLVREKITLSLLLPILISVPASPENELRSRTYTRPLSLFLIALVCFQFEL